MANVPRKKVVELYFEQNINPEGQVSYHCVLCGNRSMKNYKDHMRIDAHKARVAAYVARQEELTGHTHPSPSNISTRLFQAETPGASKVNGLDSHLYPSPTGIRALSFQSQPPSHASRENSVGHHINSSARKRATESHSTNTPHDIDQIDSEEPQRKRHRFGVNEGLPDADVETNVEGFAYDNENILSPDLLNRIINSTHASTSSLTTSLTTNRDPSIDRLTSFQVIAQKFDINPSNLQGLLQVFQETTPENRQFALACLMTQQFQHLSHRLVANERSGLAATPQLPDSTITNIWKGSESIRSHIRAAIKALMIDPETEAYSTNESDDHTPIILSVENRMLDSLHAESREFQQTHLPPGFGTRDSEIDQKVMRLIKEIAKQIRTKFQNSVLTQIKDPIEGLAVPNMMSLMGQIIRTTNAKTDHRSNEEIWALTTPAQKERFALMRLEGVHFHSTTFKNRHRSMWNAVDQRLIWLRTLSPELQAQFSQYVRDTDKLYFDGTRTIEAIQADTNFELPSPDDFLLMVPPAINTVAATV